MKTQKKKLDNIDLLILDESSANGKISNVELAKGKYFSTILLA